VTQNQQKVHCEFLTVSVQTVETGGDIVTQNQQKVYCELLTDSGQSIEDSIGQSDT
jgi:hypothetical protein